MSESDICLCCGGPPHASRVTPVIITCRCGDCGGCDARCIHGFLDYTCPQCGPEVA